MSFNLEGFSEGARVPKTQNSIVCNSKIANILTDRLGGKEAWRPTLFS